MTDADFAESIRQQIWDNQTFSDYKHYGDFYHNSSHQGTSHLSVIAENGDAVSATTTINLLWVPDVVGFRKFSWGSGVGKDRDMHVLVAWPLILICPINEAGYGGDSILLRFAPPPVFFVMRISFRIKMEDFFTERVVFSESKRRDGHDFQISFFCLCVSASFLFSFTHLSIYFFLLTPNSQLWVEISFNSYRHHL